MNFHEFSKVFPLGSHLCREPMPSMTELKKDMENLRKHGFNLVKLQEQWMVDEPVEGKYVFSRYEELIDYANKLDLGVYMGLTCEQAPGWLWRKHPECRMVGRNGLPVSYEAQMTLPADGKPGPCYDHPGAMAEQVKFIKKLVGVLGRFENIVIWNTWQEVGYWSEVFVGQPVCYCQHTIMAFQRWLKDKYGDLDQLNRTWNTRYMAWKDVLPDRCGAGYQNLPQDVAWCTFMDNVQISNILSARAAAIREADPYNRPIFCHKGSPAIGSGMDWEYARCQDFLGSSAYPAWGPIQPWDDAYRRDNKHIGREEGLLAEMWAGVALPFDHLRSSNRPGAPIWAAEFQGGPVSICLYKGRVPTPTDIRRWMLTALGSGVTGISFWVTRAEIMALEVNGFSLLDSEGESTPRFEEASRIGKAINRYPELFGENNWEKPAIAIIVNDMNYQFFRTMVNGNGHLTYSIRGWHRLLWDAGIPVDFISLSHLDEIPLSSYQTLILPFPFALSEEDAQFIFEYVEEGGNLICEAAPGRINSHSQANRGELSPLIRKLFGITQASFTNVREPEGGNRWTPIERTWGELLEPCCLEGVGEYTGYRIRANVVLQTFVCQDSTPIFTCGDATAGVYTKWGKGQAWLFGTCIGHSGTAYREKATEEFIQAIMEKCGIKQDNIGKLLLRKRVTSDIEAWIFTNPTGECVNQEINVSRFHQVEDLFDEPFLRENDMINLKVDSLDIRVLVLSHRC